MSNSNCKQVIEQIISDIHGKICDQETGEPTALNQFFDELLRNATSTRREFQRDETKDVWVFNNGDCLGVVEYTKRFTSGERYVLFSDLEACKRCL